MRKKFLLVTGGENMSQAEVTLNLCLALLLWQRRLCNPSTGKFLFPAALAEQDPTLNPNSSWAGGEMWSHLIHDLGMLQGSKSHPRHYIACLLFLALNSGGFEGKQPGRGNYWEKSQRVSCSASPRAYKGHSTWRCHSGGAVTCVSSCCWDWAPPRSASLPEPSDPCRKALGMGTDTNPTSWQTLCHRTHSNHQWPAQRFGPASLAVPLLLPGTYFGLKAPAAPLGKRITSPFLSLQMLSDIQLRCTWEGQRIVHATGNSTCESISCTQMQNLPLLSRSEAQNKPTRTHSLLFDVGQHKI